MTEEKIHKVEEFLPDGHPDIHIPQIWLDGEGHLARYRAKCSCGWQSPNVRRERDDAGMLWAEHATKTISHNVVRNATRKIFLPN